MADYQITISDPLGNQLAKFSDFAALDYVRLENDVGAFSLTLPKYYDQFLFANGDLVWDSRIGIYRSIGGRSFYLDTETIWLVRNATKILGEKGERLTSISGVCANHLLTRRIVAYNAGSAEATKTADLADDMMKAIIRENLGTLATDTDRDWSAYLSVQADQGLGPSLSKAFSRRNVLRVLQEISQSSIIAGNYIAFDVIAPTESTLEFKTYQQQRGIDHRWPNGTDPLLFGAEYGNLTGVVRSYLHEKEITYAYAGGQGEGSSRAIGTASDAVRIAQSPFGRIEAFSDARFTADATTLSDEADAKLREGQPRDTFEAQIVDTPATTYGLHYGFGDYVTAVSEGESIDCRVSRVHIRIEQGDERIDCKLRAER